MNIMDLFRPAQPQTPATATNPATGTTPPGTGPSGTSALESQSAQTQGAAALAGQAPGAQAAPLADYAKLFETVASPDGAKFQTLNADPAKIHEAAKTINFTSAVPPELITKALAGDAKSLLQAMNIVAQTAFTNSTQASSILVDRQASAAVDHMRSGLPNELKKFQVRTELQSENPAFSNPAIQPIVDVIQAQLAHSYPNASVADLKSHAQKFVMGAFSAMNPEAAKLMEAGTKAQKTEEATFGAALQLRQQAADTFDWEGWAAANPIETQNAST